MHDENNNYIGFSLFFFSIALIVLIGSVIIYNNRKIKVSQSTNKETVLNNKIKKDSKKDFVYYTLEEKVSEVDNITLKQANINIKSEDATKINKKLAEIYDNSLKSIKKSNEENVCENKSDIYSMVTLDYAIYTFNGYVTLQVLENNYACEKQIDIPNKLYSYTFDSTNGKLVSFDELLKKYNLTYTEVLKKIRENLEVSYKENNNIKVEETLNKLKENENYIIYVSENKKLVVKYIVKTNSDDYNDIIELN